MSHSSDEVIIGNNLTLSRDKARKHYDSDLFELCNLQIATEAILYHMLSVTRGICQSVSGNVITDVGVHKHVLQVTIYCIRCRLSAL